VLIEHVVETACGAELHADLVGLEVLKSDVHQFEGEPGSVLCRTPVVLVSSVGMRPEELVDQVAVGSVELNAIEVGQLDEFETVLELLEGELDVLQGHLFGGRVVSFAQLVNFLSSEGDG
jgi:hypothetical protein